MKKLLARRIDGSKAIKDNPQAAANEYFRTFYFGASHPYGRPIDEISQARITRDEIAAYHKRMYVGRNMIVLVAGDVDEKAGAMVRKAFEGIGAGSAYQWRQAKLSCRPSP